MTAVSMEKLENNGSIIKFIIVNFVVLSIIKFIIDNDYNISMIIFCTQFGNYNLKITFVTISVTESTFFGICITDSSVFVSFSCTKQAKLD